MSVCADAVWLTEDLAGKRWAAVRQDPRGPCQRLIFTVGQNSRDSLCAPEKYNNYTVINVSI